MFSSVTYIIITHGQTVPSSAMVSWVFYSASVQNTLESWHRPAPRCIFQSQKYATTASGTGVSNFDLRELSELWQIAKVKPAVVQRNSDPLNPDTLVQLYARLTGMQYQVCTSPLKAVYLFCSFCVSLP